MTEIIQAQAVRQKRKELNASSATNMVMLRQIAQLKEEA